ncbi:MAG: SecY-interacting protein [Pontibacterium sp.]
MSENTVNAALDRFITRLKVLQPDLPLTVYDADWPSVCCPENSEEGSQVPWQPVRQTESQDMFERLGEALETKIHPDLISYYSRYWSDPLPARSSDGELSLLQVWNPEDLERLRSNLIGHAMALQKQKRALTFFFACTEPDGDYFLSIDNQTGAVLVEQPGKKPLRTLANSLADYIDSLEPLPISDME